MHRVWNVKWMATGVSLVGRWVPNRELEQRFELPSGSLFKHTGILGRYHTPQYSSSDLGKLAAQPFQNQLQCDGRFLNTLVGCSTSADAVTPAFAHFVHHHLLSLHSHIQCFDVFSSCTSFLNAVTVAASQCHQNLCLSNQAWVVAGESKSKTLNPNHPKTFGLFGDGGSAAWMAPSQGEEQIWLIHHHTDSEMVKNIWNPIGGSQQPLNSENWQQFGLVLHEPKKLYKRTILRMVEAVEKGVQEVELWAKKQGKEKSTGIGWIFLHQANANILKEVRSKLGPDLQKKLVILMSDTGNLVSTSVPILRVRVLFLQHLFQLYQNRKFKNHSQEFLEFAKEHLRNTAMRLDSESMYLNQLNLPQGETLFLTTSYDSQSYWLDRLHPEEWEQFYQQLQWDMSSSRPENTCDIWVSAGGGFQTIGLVHFRGVSPQNSP